MSTFNHQLYIQIRDLLTDDELPLRKEEWYHNSIIREDGSLFVRLFGLSTQAQAREILIEADLPIEIVDWQDIAIIVTEAERSAPEYACGECGTTTATTYVVTQIDPEDRDTRTEVCRSCDDALRSKIEDVSEKLFLSQHYGVAESETHDFELSTTFGSGMLARAKNKTTGQVATAYAKNDWEALCEAAAQFADNTNA